jgi:dTDP-4-amino-4,6-dideoxygalactose transaminase
MYRHGQEEIEAVTRVMRSGHWFRYGDPKLGHLGEASAFEREWAQAMGSPQACLVGSGTAALMCCYAGLGLGPGDEVIIPGYTWIASALAPLHLGILPRIVDVDDSLGLDPEAVERAITPRTRVIDPVHMNGLACDMDALRDIARRHGLHLVEDACQADGGRWTTGERLGAIGDLGAYSFNFYKVISCGDGGAFVAKKREHFERGIYLHDGGCIFRPHAKDFGVEAYCGINLRGNEILAAILRAQLKRLDGIIDDLQRVRAGLLRRLRAEGMPLMPFNGGDATGTGGWLGLRWDGAERATRVSDELKRAGLNAFRPIDSGRHLYRNWEPVLARRGAWNAAANPFAHPANAGHCQDYAPDMLPRTLAILERTVLIAVDPDWSEEQIDANAGRIVSAAREPATA